MRTQTRFTLTAAIVATLTLGGCGGLFEVTNPGPLDDNELTVPDAVPGLITGMSADLSVALGNLQELSGLASDDIWHGGSYTAQGLWVRGVLNADDMDGDWGRMHRARWVAEDGIRRMKAIPGYTFGKDTFSARANLYAGYANRMLGEHVCFAVFDGSAEGDFRTHFSRAEAAFTEALNIATTINNTPLRQAALAGRAQALAAQGKWAAAATDAALVPSTFVFNAVFSTNTSREQNDFVSETWVRREYSVFNSPWAQVFGDPRAPWDTVKTSSGAIQKGQDGRTNYFRQRKFIDLGTEVPLAKGQEMLLIRAEAALRGGDVGTAWGFVNQARATYNMTALAIPASVDAAWPLLQFERAATLWLETRRLWDLRRFNAETGAARIGFLDSRDKCFPTATEERRSNPNIP
jgi:hypothetical protein